MTQTPVNVKLHRELGLFSAVSLIITVMIGKQLDYNFDYLIIYYILLVLSVILNFIIGSGIFVSASNALKNSGSVNMCLIIWMSCGLLALLGNYIKIKKNYTQVDIIQVYYFIFNLTVLFVYILNYKYKTFSSQKISIVVYSQYRLQSTAVLIQKICTCLK